MGKVEWAQCWRDYKAARDKILTKENDAEMRLILVTDLREEFRTNYPHWDYKWN